MSNGDTVQVYNPQGMRGTIPKANLDAAKGAGYMAVDDTVVAIHPKTGERGFIPRSNWTDASKAGYIMAPEQQIGEERGAGMHGTDHPRLTHLGGLPWVDPKPPNMKEVFKKANEPLEEMRKKSPLRQAGEAALMFSGTTGIAKGLSALPSAARAGETFESVAQAMQNIRVPITRAMASADRAAEVIGRGGKSSKLISDFVSKVTGPTVSWQEARDFLSNAKSRSKLAELFEGQTGHARYAIAEFVESLGEEVMSAARQAGQGKAYAQALKEYRHAKQIARALKAGAIVGGAYVLHKMDATEAKTRVSELLRRMEQ